MCMSRAKKKKIVADKIELTVCRRVSVCLSIENKINDFVYQ